MSEDTNYTHAQDFILFDSIPQDPTIELEDSDASDCITRQKMARLGCTAGIAFNTHTNIHMPWNALAPMWGEDEPTTPAVVPAPPVQSTIDWEKFWKEIGVDVGILGNEIKEEPPTTATAAEISYSSQLLGEFYETPMSGQEDYCYSTPDQPGLALCDRSDPGLLFDQNLEETDATSLAALLQQSRQEELRRQQEQLKREEEVLLRLQRELSEQVIDSSSHQSQLGYQDSNQPFVPLPLTEEDFAQFPLLSPSMPPLDVYTPYFPHIKQETPLLQEPPLLHHIKKEPTETDTDLDLEPPSPPPSFYTPKTALKTPSGTTSFPSAPSSGLPSPAPTTVDSFSPSTSSIPLFPRPYLPLPKVTSKPKTIHTPPHLNPLINPSPDLALMYSSLLTHQDLSNLFSPHLTPSERTNNILTLPPGTDNHFHCPHVDCTSTHSRRYNLKTHYGEVHEGLKNFECRWCGERFARKYDCMRHRINAHPGEEMGLPGEERARLKGESAIGRRRKEGKRNGEEQNGREAKRRRYL